MSVSMRPVYVGGTVTIVGGMMSCQNFAMPCVVQPQATSIHDAGDLDAFVKLVPTTPTSQTEILERARRTLKLKKPFIRDLLEQALGKKLVKVTRANRSLGMPDTLHRI